MKKCTKCGEENPATNDFFHQNKASKDGLAHNCKRCATEKAKEWRKNNSEKKRLTDQEYRKNNSEKINQAKRNWVQKNREKNKAYKVKYYQKNKALVFKRSKAWIKENKERYDEWSKKWRKKNKSKILASAQKHRNNNKDTVRRRIKIWHLNNPGKVKQYAAKYRSRKKELPYTLTAKQWGDCMNHFNCTCAYCGKPSKILQQEHFISLSAGGPYTINNIIPACKSCNSSKQDKDFFDWYPKQPFYSKRREAKILKYLNYDKEGKQQASIFEVI